MKIKKAKNGKNDRKHNSILIFGIIILIISIGIINFAQSVKAETKLIEPKKAPPKIPKDIDVTQSGGVNQGQAQVIGTEGIDYVLIRVEGVEHKIKIQTYTGSYTKERLPMANVKKDKIGNAGISCADIANAPGRKATITLKGAEDGVDIRDFLRSKQPPEKCLEKIVINTGNGNDYVHAGEGPDDILLGDGDDRAFGYGGADKICAGPGDDGTNKEKLSGGKDTDEIMGEDGTDKALCKYTDPDKVEGNNNGEKGEDDIQYNGKPVCDNEFLNPQLTICPPLIVTVTSPPSSHIGGNGNGDNQPPVLA